MNNKNIIKYYNKIKSVTKTAKHFKSSKYKIAKLLRNNNIEIINHQNKVRMNQYFFDIIDTEQKAYWLGFIYADGNLYNNSLTISLQLCDLNHLEKFKKDIEFSGVIYKLPKINKCIITFSNKHLAKNIYNKGVVPCKSLILKFPTNKQVPDHLIRHFIRGYFDGDGGISLVKNKLIPIMSIAGTKNFLEGCNNYFTPKIPLYNIKNSQINMLQVSHLTACSHLTWLYLDSKIYLSRKYNKYLNIMYEYEGQIPKKILCLTDNKTYWDTKSAAEYYNIKKATLKSHLQQKSITITKNKLKFKYL